VGLVGPCRSPEPVDDWLLRTSLTSLSKFMKLSRESKLLSIVDVVGDDLPERVSCEDSLFDLLQVVFSSLSWWHTVFKVVFVFGAVGSVFFYGFCEGSV